jgi:hypothetical protein
MRIEREMAPISTFDIIVGLSAVGVAAIAIYLFIRASSETSKAEPREEAETEKEITPSPPSVVPFRKGNFQIPDVEHHLNQSEVERARSSIRTLTLQSELYSMMLKRLFEAEDDGEITREERLSLSKGYEADLKRISKDLKRSELIVSLHELENIRDDILRRFEDTLNSTQNRIDTILRELKLEEKKKAPPRAPSRRKPAKKEEKEEPEEEEKAKPPKPKSDVEAKLEQLRKEVLKELEELDKLELEA